MKPTARWTLTVSGDTNRRVRRFLDEAGRRGDLSRFVEDAVKARLLVLSLSSVPTHGLPAANEVAPKAPESIDNRGDRQHGG